MRVQTVRQMSKKEPDELLLNCVADLCTYLRGVDSPTEWAFFGNSTAACAPPLKSWKRCYSRDEGYHLVATRYIHEGEIILSELPILSAKAPSANVPGWAQASLCAFCKASTATQKAVLCLHSGSSHASCIEEYAVAKRLISEEVQRCASKAWRTARAHIADSVLERVCLVIMLNAYAFGSKSDLMAIFATATAMNHSCEANVRADSSVQPGCGCFLAKRAIHQGEALTTNYIGGLVALMSTTARRQALLASKLFVCRCRRCCEDADVGRRVPCPVCHPRQRSLGGDCEFSKEVALGRVLVHYAMPLSGEPDALWWCEHCEQTHDDAAVMPGPMSQGGLAGRNWETVVEQHVLNMDRMWCDRGSMALGELQLLFGEARDLFTSVSLSMGNQHWTTRRLHEILSEMASSTSTKGFQKTLQRPWSLNVH